MDLRIWAAIPTHRARSNKFLRRCVFPQAGPIAPPAEEAVGIFTAFESGEEYINGDPFVLTSVAVNGIPAIGLKSSHRLVMSIEGGEVAFTI